jgi:hypothetical protein
MLLLLWTLLPVSPSSVGIVNLLTLQPATAQNYGLNLLRLEDVSNGYVY